MKKKVLYLSIFSIVIIFAVLFSACSISNNIDPNENTTDPDSIINENNTDSTKTKNVYFGLYDCFVAPDPEEFPEFVEEYDSYDCVPGYLYLKKEVYGEIKLLLAKNVKQHIPVHNLSETRDKVFIVTEDDEIIRVNKQDGAYETIYKAQYGSIDLTSSINSYNKFMYYTDGDYIIRIDPSTDESMVYTHSDNGVTIISPCDCFGNVEGYFHCDVCLENRDGLVWADNDYNYYWYHPETGENESFSDPDDLYWRTD